MEHISKKAQIGKNVTIGPWTIINDNVAIGDNTAIESHCVIGAKSKLAKGKLVIGANSYIRSHSVIYEGSQFGQNLITGHSVLVRENCISGRNLQIGTGTDIEGDCEFGNYVKIHSQGHVSKKNKLGDFVWLFPRVQFTGDPLPPSDFHEGIIIKDMAVVATGALLLPGTNIIGLGSFVAAGSVVKNNVPDIYCVAGNPAAVFARVDRFVSVKYKISYPWAKNFRTGYPPESYPLMEKILAKIEDLIKKDSKK